MAVPSHKKKKKEWHHIDSCQFYVAENEGKKII